MDKETLNKKYKLLVKYGFMKDNFKSEFAGKTPVEMEEAFEKRKYDLKEMADIEKAEIAKGQMIETGYPKPIARNHLIFESSKDNIEETYYFQKDHLRTDCDFVDFYKITDVFTASPNSSFWGAIEQRVGLQQDKAAQFLRGVSEMTKAMFQIVRELRIIDERLQYYKNVKEDNKNALASEITLKGIFIDQVEGGSKNPSSVYGLASNVGFAILPDVFFRTQVKKIEELNEQVDKQPFNEKVKEVEKRKLLQYYEWFGKTYDELVQRRKFTLAYLRQHFDTIHLYISWIKPYLRNIERLSQDQKKFDDVDLVSSFEGSLLEVEFLASKGSAKIRPCIDIHFLFRTRPQMSYVQQDSYQKGPSHLGRVEMTIRAYAWSENQIEAYRAMRKEEDLQMLVTIDQSLKAAMEGLGTELTNYLKEANEKDLLPKEESKEQKKEKRSMKKKAKEAFEPFISIFGGFSELFLQPFGLDDILHFDFSGMGKKGKEAFELAKANKEAESTALATLWLAYKNYKKAHRMITW